MRVLEEKKNTLVHKMKKNTKEKETKNIFFWIKTEHVSEKTLIISTSVLIPTLVFNHNKSQCFKLIMMNHDKSRSESRCRNFGHNSSRFIAIYRD